VEILKTKRLKQQWKKWKIRNEQRIIINRKICNTSVIMGLKFGNT
jgi:hypothetical protein